MRRLLAIMCCLVSSRTICAQTVDWHRLFQELASPDVKIQDRARAELFEVNPKLAEADSAAFAKEVAGVLEAFNDSNEKVRLNASGMLAAWAILRQDGSVVLRQAIPILLSHFNDPNPRIRANAVRSIVVLRPEVPEELYDSFKSLLMDNDATVAELAVHGIARFTKKRPEALKELEKLLSPEQPHNMRLTVLLAMRSSEVKDPALTARIEQIFDGNDRELKREAINVASWMGRAAATLKTALQRIASDKTDNELADEANAAVAALNR